MQTLGALRFDPDDASILLCPKCTGAFLHSTYVVAYDRKEGGLKTFETFVDGIDLRRTVADAEASDNPSEHRHGIAIGFWCEACGEDDEFELTLAQHKGETLAQWRVVESDS